MNETYITFAGWVGSAPELRTVAGGQQVASFRVGSTPRRFRDGEWVNGPTAWHQVKAWRRLGVHVAASLTTGDPVVVHGRLVADVWEKEDGTVVTQYVVVATTVGHDLSQGTARFERDKGAQWTPEQRREPAADRPTPVDPAVGSAEPETHAVSTEVAA